MKVTGGQQKVDKVTTGKADVDMAMKTLLQPARPRAIFVICYTCGAPGRNGKQ